MVTTSQGLQRGSGKSGISEPAERVRRDLREGPREAPVTRLDDGQAARPLGFPCRALRPPPEGGPIFRHGLQCLQQTVMTVASLATTMYTFR